MAYSSQFQETLDFHLLSWLHVMSRKMFGGLYYMVNGKMFAFAFNDVLVGKLPDDARAETFQSAEAKPFEHTYGPFGQWTQFLCDDPEQADLLLPWLRQAYDYVSSLSETTERKKETLPR